MRRTPKAVAKNSNVLFWISHEVLWECDASLHRFATLHRLQKKSGGRFRTAALKLSILPEQEFYEDLYLTEHPYGFVSGVATDLPAND